MGSRGPIPKRSDQKAGHRTKSELDTDKVDATDEVLVPDVDPTWHPIAHDWYCSLARSAQSQFYEQSDWEHARYVAQAMSQNLLAAHFSANLFAAVTSAMGELGSTEGARRRMKIEIQRAIEEPAGEVTPIERYRRRAAGG
jgi:hypothetical protein